MATFSELGAAFKKILLERKSSEGSEENPSEKECPVHSRFAPPSLTLQHNGCLSCAALNRSAEQNSAHESDHLHMEHPKNESFQPCNMRSSNSWRGARGNVRMPRRGLSNAESHRLRREREEELKKVRDLFDLSRTFHRQMDLESDSKVFDGAGVNPYPENSHSFARNRDSRGSVSRGKVSNGSCPRNKNSNDSLHDAQDGSEWKNYSRRGGHDKLGYQNPKHLD